MIDYYSYLRRQPNFKHPVGVSMALPDPHRFVPRPGMTPEQIAYGNGAQAALLGLPASRNPHEGVLAEHWNRGYNENQTSSS